MFISHHKLKLGIISFPLVVIFLFTSGCYNRQIFHLYDLPKPSGSHSIGTIQFDWVHPDFINLFDQETEKKKKNYGAILVSRTDKRKGRTIFIF